MTYRYLPNYALRMIQMVLLFEAIIRGVIYIVARHQLIPELAVITRSAPLAVWGTAFVAFGTLGLFGEALLSGTPEATSTEYTPRALPSFLAHAGLMTLYAAWTLATFAAMLPPPTVPWASMPYDLAMLSLLNWLYARRRKGQHR